MTPPTINREAADTEAAALAQSVLATRRLSLELAAPLSPEDQTVQAMDDASPTKWHLAHVTWFFEVFVLGRFLHNYRVFDERYAFCFNSYYETIGPRHPRPRRGLLTRPSCEEILSYRQHVDEGLDRLFASGAASRPEVADVLKIGLNHEQQHQELLLTDILALFAQNPLRPAYRLAPPVAHGSVDAPASWTTCEGGVRPIGYSGRNFHWDNEAPKHDALIYPFRICNRLVTNGEWLDFMEDGGYATATLWLSDGWNVVQREAWRAPLYFEEVDGEWRQMGLHGLRAIDRTAPVSHISFYEADAFARWAGKRLPTEFEWETASALAQGEVNDLGARLLAPRAASEGPGLRQMFGDVWEWTQSAYLPYPGYRPAPGALGEYNGKFMSGQMTLRGGSCVTPRGHSRPTYRNFFYPWQRWQFKGMRLAEDAR